MGENHPQDPNGLSEEMKLYWVFQEKRDTTTQRNDVSRSIKVSNPVPRNAAAGSHGLQEGCSFLEGKGDQETCHKQLLEKGEGGQETCHKQLLEKGEGGQETCHKQLLEKGPYLEKG